MGLGSNNSFCFEGIILDPVSVLKKACELLSVLFFEGSFLVSSVYKTKPLYYTDQHDFYNMAAKGLYEGSPEDLLSKTQAIEAFLGRNRSKELRNGPRTLDIDIEIFGSERIKTDTLTIPHEKIEERAFVLIPLLEILPDYADPISGVKYNTIVSTLPDQGVLKFIAPFDLH